MIITQVGTVCYDADFYPWGAEQYVKTNTCPVQNYKFTGKERDPDMGEDYFGARFYKGDMSRFFSPDWSSGPEPVPYAKLDHPQTLNLYSYVGNNPTTLRDLDGHEEDPNGGGGASGPPAGDPTNGTQQNTAADKAATADRVSQGLRGLGETVGGALAAFGLAAGAELDWVVIVPGEMAASGEMAKGAADMGQAVSPEGKTDVSQAKEAVSAVTNPVSLTVTILSGGNIKLGNEAQKVADSAKTMKDEQGKSNPDRSKQIRAFSDIVNTVRGWGSSLKGYYSPPPPPLPPQPVAPANLR